MLTKQLEKKLDANYTRILRAILNKSWQQHPTRHQLYGHLPPITKTIQVRRTRHATHCWRCRDELISDVLLWTPTYSRAKAGRPARTELCEDTGCSSEDLQEAMNDREKLRERVRDIRASGTTCWWWYKVYLNSNATSWALWALGERKIKKIALSYHLISWEYITIFFTFGNHCISFHILLFTPSLFQVIQLWIIKKSEVFCPFGKNSFTSI